MRLQYIENGKICLENCAKKCTFLHLSKNYLSIRIHI